MSRHSILQPYAEHTEKERPIEILLDQCLRSHALGRRGLVLALAALGACIGLAAGEVAAFRLADGWGGDMRGLSLWTRLSIFWKSKSSPTL